MIVLQLPQLRVITHVRLHNMNIVVTMLMVVLVLLEQCHKIVFLDLLLI